MQVAAKRIGIMGGTFDPIHLGHLLAAEAAYEAAELDEVWFMPTHVPPHKTKQPEAGQEYRWQMVELAVAPVDYFHASKWELEQGGISYTWDTVQGLQAQYPNVNWYWIIGGDMVAYLPQWHAIEELMSAIHFIGLQRPGSSWTVEALPPAWQQRIIEVAMPQLDISSTNIRKRRKDGRSIRFLVPDTVEQYVKRWELYETDSR
ncbi:nicotinate-nucleotide adenylyltransferase [Paenibacillus agilis]|uniref:Probable nicotinate-nucleotide adenylyltransferase n=1 Tax=Paenibacillus agilis TaxID=3020863 RepID=A0A559J384_9BACL|nr:nicotinate-nucleotide adenylyltransferase [Paenibacillus agilis]TVX94350.1 nicotinate-nucleotide adenylyltransferase [Paenibacillus agilis]